MTRGYGAPCSINGARLQLNCHSVQSIPPRMPTWLWHWREPSSDSDVDIAVELMWHLWIELACYLPYHSPPPRKWGFWELVVRCGEGLYRFLEVRVPIRELMDWPRYMTPSKDWPRYATRTKD
ncbi:hypothetical protein B296_00036906 [Ensete ventricosum]|uniref:Uncharacterized protein n=1 Tax=Ensete ventricosum TaxID=4639 RepID=A0A426YRT2_ENSVE|nr:hypothetical protein B296_00036906 [Ensete ventricosum]